MLQKLTELKGEITKSTITSIPHFEIIEQIGDQQGNNRLEQY